MKNWSRIILLMIWPFLTPGPVASQEATVESIGVPAGYERLVFPAGSFSRFIQQLPLKGRPVILRYDGAQINARYDVLAVIALPLLFNEDIEQCADYGMRFWAEYHKASNKLDQLYLFDYGGKKLRFKDQDRSFRDFVRLSMAYSNSHSIKVGGRAVGADELAPGDMFVQNETGGIGHVSVIVDACRNSRGEKLFLIGFSFMPAQEFHIEKAPPQFGTGGWFSFQGYCRFLEAYYSFGEPHLRRF